MFVHSELFRGGLDQSVGRLHIFRHPTMSDAETRNEHGSGRVELYQVLLHIS